MIWVMFVECFYNFNVIKMVEFIQCYLCDVGVEVIIVSYDWIIFRCYFQEGLYDLVLIGWFVDNGDLDNFYCLFLSCGVIFLGINCVMWCSEDYDKLFNDVFQIDDIEECIVIYW